jgi:hypothetical protein
MQRMIETACDNAPDTATDAEVLAVLAADNARQMSAPQKKEKLAIPSQPGPGDGGPDCLSKTPDT